MSEYKLEIKSTLEQLIEQERILQFEVFDFEVIDQICTNIIKEGSKIKENKVCVRVVLNGTVVYQVFTNLKKNLEWFHRKEKTVNETGHSSILVAKKHIEYGDYQHMISNEYALCGGGFPVIVNGELCGTITVSGLEHEDDHNLIVNAIRKQKNL